MVRVLSSLVSAETLSTESEQQRLEALHRYDILDTLPEQNYDDITELAAFICGTPISLISLVDKDRQWFKSEQGLGARETPRSQSFCAHTIPSSQTLIVEDATQDARFRDNPLVLGDPNIRFYAGAPIIEPGGLVLGTVCVIDSQPRTITPKQVSALEALARQVVVLLEQRKTISTLQHAISISEVTEEGLKQVLTATSDAVFSVNRDWVLTYLNPMAEKLYGASKDLVGRNLWQAFPDAVYEGSPFVEHYYRAMDEGIAGSFEAVYADPLNFTLGLEVYPSAEGIVTFSRDITRLNHAKAAVIQTEKLAAVGRLASSIAHEINNPLESVTNLLYLARTTTEPVELDGYLEQAERELHRVSAITNQTLRFYRQTTDPSLVTCTDLFNETLILYQGKLVNSNIQVEQRKRATKAAVCFEGEIRQVLSNLIGNAIDAMHAGGGRLILRSRETTNWKTGQRGLSLTVADTGFGMTSQVRKRVFEAFYSTKGIGGTGLGLWLSKEIVDRHTGTLNVRSSQQPDAHGTVFTLFLPFDFAAS